jgi:hypothetical protein
MASAPIDALPATRARGERPLYTTAALAGALVMFAGFAPSYYLKSLVGTPELTTLKHFHGVVMTTWFVLFFVQARLVATGTHGDAPAARPRRYFPGRGRGGHGNGAGDRDRSARACRRCPASAAGLPGPAVGEWSRSGRFLAAIALRKRGRQQAPHAARELTMLRRLRALPTDAIGLSGPPVFFALTDLLSSDDRYDTVKNRRVHPAFAAARVHRRRAGAGSRDFQTAAWTPSPRGVIGWAAVIISCLVHAPPCRPAPSTKSSGTRTSSARSPDGTALIYIDRHVVHEVTSPQAFEGLEVAHRKPWRIGSVVATADHNVPTTPDRNEVGIADPISRLQVETLDKNVDKFHVKTYFGMKDQRQGSCT